MRNPSAIDYSKPIFDWLNNCKSEAAEKWEVILAGVMKKKQKELLGDLEISKLPNFKAVDMHNTRFCDMRFRLGAGYLYCHQVCCCSLFQKKLSTLSFISYFQSNHAKENDL